MFLRTLGPVLFLTSILGAATVLAATLAEASAFRGDTLPFPGKTRLAVLGDTVVIAAPSGYCIDPLGSLAETRVAFVLMASCRSITGDDRAAEPRVHGLLSASVDGRDGGFPTQNELARFFASSNGRAALSRSGNPDAMKLDAVYSRDGVLYLHANETGADAAMGGQSWRAVFEINGRMVTATLRDLAGHPIPRSDGFKVVEGFVEQIVAASGVGH